MKKVYLLLVAVMLVATSCNKNDDISEALSMKNDNVNVKDDCVKADPGYNEFNYNYVAHMYNGDYYGNGGNLIMKWNEAWLSSSDCDGDGELDRHVGFDTYIGSGAWLTNHETGTYEVDGVICEYDYFIKIIAPPADAELKEKIYDSKGVLVGGNWYNSDDVLIGPVIWGQFAILQEIYNDPCAGYDGVYFKSDDRSGLGNW